MSNSSFYNSKDLAFDQNLLGIWSYLKGNYRFKTDLIESTYYEIQYITETDSPRLHRIQLIYENKILLEFILEKTNSIQKNSLEFSIYKEAEFDFLKFCILFKYLYQYLNLRTQYLNYEYLILRTDRYDSYALKKYLGFKKIASSSNKKDLLLFDLTEGLQTIWDQFYGSRLEYNLHHFILPIESGGYAPSNIKLHQTLKKPQTLFQHTHKRTIDTSTPLTATLKDGYKNMMAIVKDLSENGIGLRFLPDNIHQIKKDNIYTVWLHNEDLHIKWIQLSVQVLWVNETEYGCHILDKTNHWNNFLTKMNLQENQRLTFIKPDHL